MQLAPVGGKRDKVDALQADRGLIQIDELHAGNRTQDSAAASTTPATPGMLVQRHLQLDALAHAGLETAQLDLRNRMNGVISNGRAPPWRSMAGSVVSVNCT